MNGLTALMCSIPATTVLMAATARKREAGSLVSVGIGSTFIGAVLFNLTSTMGIAYTFLVVATAMTDFTGIGKTEAT
ncbi:hypothetical protein ACFYYS_00355 [Streptomyces sp. NPDC002120]|uniref:hypothetical protein n=1 Tax=Streptomyces sp. NPDC002120 TaxID=3364631 RepID=UPI0036BDE721